MVRPVDSPELVEPATVSSVPTPVVVSACAIMLSEPSASSTMGDGLRLGYPARAQRRQDLFARDAFRPHGAFEKSAPVQKQCRHGLDQRLERRRADRKSGYG